jgi:hypothetical protein
MFEGDMQDVELQKIFLWVRDASMCGGDMDVATSLINDLSR